MVYLDSAATTLRKPASVSFAAARAIRMLASPGRGGYDAAEAADRLAFACRAEAAELFGMGDAPERVVFTFNATHALNIAIHSIVRPGGCAVISGYEHNAVTRPLHALENVRVKTADAPPFRPEEMLARFDQLLTPEVDAAICTHVSNVFGYILPINEIASLCRERGIPLIVDASQSAGCLPVDPVGWEATFVAMPGHKGLYGPQGTGLLLCGRDETLPLLYGGTGSASRSMTMPDFLPDRLEAGTHNMPGIAGLLEGIRFVRRRGVERIRRHESTLVRRLANGLKTLRDIEVFAGEDGAAHIGAVSFRCRSMDCQVVGQMLARRGIAVRSGLHCAPTAHATAGTLDSGTVRASVCAFTAPEETDRLIVALGEMLS